MVDSGLKRREPSRPVPVATTVDIFLCAWAANIGVELVRILRYYESDAANLPHRYGRPSFWICRLLLTLIAGGLAVAYGVDKCIPALHIGASAPFILEALGRIRGDVGSKAPPPAADTQD